MRPAPGTPPKRRLAPPGPLHLGGDLRIPQVLHRIWFGPMRRFHLDYGTAIRDLYEPLGWTVQEWTLDHATLPWMPTEHIADAVRRKRYAQASDIMRYAIIHRVGGLYVDSDAEPVADCTDALRGRDLLLVPESRVMLNNCYLGAVPGNPLLAYLLQALPARLAQCGGAAVEYVTGPQWITQVWHDFADSGITWPLPPRDPWMPYRVVDLVFPSDSPSGLVASGRAAYQPDLLWCHHWNSERSKRGKRATNWALNRRIV